MGRGRIALLFLAGWMLCAGAVAAVDQLEEAVEDPCRGSDEFHCIEGGSLRCIPRIWVCNNVKDCHDGSDELPASCPDHANEECYADQIECPTTKKCIPKNWLCDGSADCDDGLDEMNCSSEVTGCSHTEFACVSDNRCVSHLFTCDGTEDCADGSDELHCECSTPDTFSCDDGHRCPPIASVCDKRTDCKDASDEGGRCDEECSLSCPNGACYPSPIGSRCHCNAGYREETGQQCLDIDECGEGSPCDHFCFNTPGNYTCRCAGGYRAEHRGMCKAIDKTPAILFYTMRNEINALDITNKEAFSLHRGTAETIAVAFEPVTGMVYWSDASGKVFKKTFKGEGPEVVVLRKDLGMVYSIAIDWRSRNMYLACKEEQNIVVCNIDTMACKDLLAQTASPFAIQLDIAHRSIYWTESNAIMKASMDGTKVQPLLSENIKWPNALAIDSPARTLYWLDSKLRTLETFSLDNHERKRIPEVTVEHPFSLAVWEDRLYWSDWKTNDIVSAHKKDGKDMKVIFSDAPGHGISIYHNQMREDTVRYEDTCKSFGCSHICLPSTNKAKATCGCPNEMEISSDQKTCQDKEGYSSLVIGLKNEVYKVKIRDFSDYLPERVTRAPGAFKRVTDVDYNPITREIFVCDQESRKIMKIEMDKGNSLTTIVTNLTKPTGIAADWSRRLLYWVDYIEGTLEVSTMKGLYRSRLDLGGLVCKGLDVAVSPLKGRVIIACDSPNARIVSCSRNGGPCTVLSSHKIKRPLGLTVDQRSRGDVIFWTDSHLRRVERMNLNGTERKSVELKHKAPAAIHLSDGKLYISIVGDEKTLMVTDNLHDFVFEDVHINLGESVTAMDAGGHVALTSINWLVQQPSLSTSYDNFCSAVDNPCQQLCLEDQDAKMVCACATGEMLGLDNTTCITFDCGDDRHTCVTDGKCLDKSFRCDGQRSCSDGSDESQTFCQCDESVHFGCLVSKECIAVEKKCDGHDDCLDHSDEENCPEAACPSGYSACSTGGCYLDLFRCNGRADCPSDGTDELDCPACPEKEFRCADGIGLCHPNEWLCNGIPDCLDNSDEQNCTQSCGYDFTCRDDGSCLDRSKLCDAKYDCDDGEDENLEICYKQPQVCDGDWSCKKDCAPEEFACMSGALCIDARLRCDGVSNCEDASDEVDCPTIVEASVVTMKDCDRGMFNCGLGDCIKGTKVCDGNTDCDNGSDEGPACEEVCADGGVCNHNCTATPESYKCFCRGGYRLHDDGHTCLDIDECAYADPCEQYCTNVEGRFLCSCDDGYSLASDAMTCSPMSGRQSRTVVVSGLSIKWFGAPSEAPKTMEMSRGSNISSIAFDNLRNNLLSLDYAGVLGVITTHDSSSFSPVMDGLKKPSALAVDAPGRNVYIAQFMTGANHQVAKLMVCSLRSKQIVCWSVYEESNVVISAIAVARKDRRMYICVNGVEGSEVAKIIQMHLDGSRRIVILDKGVRRCSHLAIDEPKEMVYWVDPSRMKIYSAKWTGHAVEEYKQLETVPVNLEVSGFYVTWLLPNGTQQRCRKHTNWCRPLHLEASSLAVTVPAVQDTQSTVCHSESCKNLCITVAGKPLCLCDDPTSPRCSAPNVLRSVASCEPDPCAPGGMCLKDEAGGYTCRCSDGYEGSSCYVTKKSLDEGSSYVTPLVVVLIVLTLAATAAGLYYYYKRPLLFFKKGKSSKSQVRFSNPAFGAPKDEIDATLRSTAVVSGNAPGQHPCDIEAIHIDTDVNLMDDCKETGSDYSGPTLSQGHYPLM